MNWYKSVFSILSVLSLLATSLLYYTGKDWQYMAFLCTLLWLAYIKEDLES